MSMASTYDTCLFGNIITKFLFDNYFIMLDTIISTNL
jgi:hypothetical protein